MPDEIKSKLICMQQCLELEIMNYVNTHVVHIGVFHDSRTFLEGRSQHTVLHWCT